MPNSTQAMDAVIKHMSCPFSYSNRADCCRTVSGVYYELFGYYPMPGLTYSDRASAMKLIKSYGSFIDCVTGILLEQDFLEVSKEDLTQVGDIGVLENKGNPTLGIAVTELYWAVKSGEGFVLKQKNELMRSFRQCQKQ